MLKRSVFIIFFVLLIDQILKIYIKTHFTLGEEVFILGRFFRLYFVENNGMAFGLEFGGSIGKFILSIVRILVIAIIGMVLFSYIKKNENKILIYAMSFVFAGALGNIIDSAFYGLIFSESHFLHTASIFPESGGYAGFLQGKVVDMIYVPLIETTLPQWMPFVGGNEFVFFRPIFNIADSSITIGVLIIVIFYHKIFPKKSKKEIESTI